MLRRWFGRNRLHYPRLGFKTSLAISLGTTVLALVLLLLTGLDVGTSLGVAGLVFGVATFGVTEYRQREPPSRQVVYVPQSDKTFNANIFEGLQEALRDSLWARLLPQTPKPSDLHHLEAWQVKVLQSQAVRKAAAVVIAPPRDDPRIWGEVVNLIRGKIFVVVVDIQPDRQFFMERGLQPPAFVASDFKQGGRAVGEIIARELEKDPKATALISLGPNESWPGTTRSSWLIYELARRSLLPRVSIYELPSWHPEDFMDQFYEVAVEFARNEPRPAIIYCGTDRIMQALERRISRHGEAALQCVRLIGYDGAVSNDGRLIAEDCPHSIATIDTRPHAQGRAAAQILRDAHYGSEGSRYQISIVEPVALLSPDWNH